MFLTGAADKKKKKKFPDTQTQPPEGPWDFKESSTVPQRHLNTRCRREEEGGEVEGRNGNGELGGGKKRESMGMKGRKN